jgi:Tol biopolymer transport system component
MWSPNGAFVVFRSNRTGRYDLYRTSSDRGGAGELLFESEQDKNATDWSRDGRFLMFITEGQEGALNDLWVLSMTGDRKAFGWLRTPFNERRGQFSPDGRWVAYQSDESGRNEIYVRPFDGQPSSASDGQWQVSSSGGISPRWAANGNELYYIAPDGKLMAAPVSASATTFAPGTPAALFQTRIFGGENAGTQYDVSDDGRFLINTTLDDVNAPIRIIENWDPERQR